MKQHAIKMKLLPGNETEYKKRHDEIWPALTSLLKKSGVCDYSIFLDSDGITLFGVFTSTDENALDNLPNNEIMQKWWGYMSDIMQCNPDNSPKTENLNRVFFLK